MPPPVSTRRRRTDAQSAARASATRDPRSSALNMWLAVMIVARRRTTACTWREMRRGAIDARPQAGGRQLLEQRKAMCSAVTSCELRWIAGRIPSNISVQARPSATRSSLSEAPLREHAVPLERVAHGAFREQRKDAIQVRVVPTWLVGNHCDASWSKARSAEIHVSELVGAVFQRQFFRHRAHGESVILLQAVPSAATGPLPGDRHGRLSPCRQQQSTHGQGM